MNKKETSKQKKEEKAQKAKVIKEFIPDKQKLLDIMINGLLKYVSEGEMPESVPTSFMDCYNIIYEYADKDIVDYLIKFHNEIIIQASKECYEKIQNLSSLDFIDSFITYTDRLNILIYHMSKIFLYITNNHLRDIKDSKDKKIYKEDYISEFSMQIYKENFFDNLEEKLFNVLNGNLIREERNGNKEHRMKISYIMKTLNYLDFIKPDIAKITDTKITWIEKTEEESNKKFPYQHKWYNDYFKQETIRYIKNKSEKDIKNNSAPEYVQCELKYLNEENERENNYIKEEFHNDINNINYEYLIKNNMNQLIEMDTGVNYLFQTKKKEQLSEVYELFKLYPESLTLVQKSFRAYIKERLTLLYNDKELTKDPRKFIPVLIALKKEMDNFVVFCFQNNNDFQDEENKEFSLLMSKELYPKQLANYSDFCMRIGFKGKSEPEIDSILNDIISIFKIINSKLIFRIESEKKMSERLIKGSSLSINAEKLLISKLKQEMGVIFVSKMNEMINDLEKNKSEIDGYKRTPSEGVPNGIKFNVQVITQSAWEINKTSMEKIEIPRFLEICTKDFEKYYIGRHQQTKLIWCFGLSKLEIQYLYLNNKNISISTLIQFLALLHLELKGKLTLEEISLLLGCNVKKVINDIRGLIFNPSFNQKGQIDKGVISANIDPKTKEFKPSTEISINMDFSVPHQKFNTIPLASKKTADEIKASEIEEAKIAKRYQENIIQATVTRIMKTRIGQNTTHVWLVGEASKQIDLFKVQPQQIKENIEKLIEKNVIKRDGACYEYIA